MNHQNLSDEINRNISKSEIEGGVYLDKLEVGSVLHVRTKNTSYSLEKREDGFYISGNPKYCPEPTKAHINGSTWGGSMLKVDFVGRGMHLEFSLEKAPEDPKLRGFITTSEIQDITEVK